MEQEKKIAELQQRIEGLSRELDNYRQELQELKKQADHLSNGQFSAAVSKEVTTSPEQNTLEHFIGLKLIHIAGIIVLVTGLSIGVKYAIDRELISELSRILLAYLAGAVLFVLSLRLKKNYKIFSAILVSGSMASLYFTTYAAFVYYGFFPPIVAFLIMAALTVYTIITSISYNRQEIGILGMVGAYGIPFLISSNSERVDLLFSYVLLINLGVAFLSFRKSWKTMSYLAMLITWTLFIGWGITRYENSWLTTAFAFLAIYYLLFLLLALAPRITGKTHHILPGAIQQVLINNAAMYLGALVVFTNLFFDPGADTVTGIVAVVTGALALAVSFIYPNEITLQRLLAWQALILLAMFIALRWNGLTVTLLWLVLSVALFVWGILGKKAWPRLGALLLIGITLGKLAIFDSISFTTVQKIISFIVIGSLLLVFSFYYQKYKRI